MFLKPWIIQCLDDGFLSVNNLVVGKMYWPAISDCFKVNEPLIQTVTLAGEWYMTSDNPSVFNACFGHILFSKGQIKKLSEMNLGGTEGWFSWSYNRLVKKPVGWGFKWLSGQQEQDTPTETFVVLDVLKVCCCCC